MSDTTRRGFLAGVAGLLGLAAGTRAAKGSKAEGGFLVPGPDPAVPYIPFDPDKDEVPEPYEVPYEYEDKVEVRIGGEWRCVEAYSCEIDMARDVDVVSFDMVPTGPLRATEINMELGPSESAGLFLFFDVEAIRITRRDPFAHVVYECDVVVTSAQPIGCTVGPKVSTRITAEAIGAVHRRMVPVG